jgi:hypothetical protein
MNQPLSYPVPSPLIIEHLCEGHFVRAVSNYREESCVTLKNGAVVQMRLKTCVEYLRAIRAGCPIIPLAVSEGSYMLAKTPSSIVTAFANLDK